MASKFKIPKYLEDLTQPPDENEENTLYAQNVIEIDALSPTEIHSLVTAIATELAEKDVLCVLEQSVFDQLYSLVRGYTFLQPSIKSIFLDSLCTNFVQLNVATTIFTKSAEDSTDDAEDPEGVLLESRAHWSAIKIYAYFLLCIVNAEEAEPDVSTEKGAENLRNSKGRSRKKHILQEWDWNTFRTRSLRILAGALQNDLKSISESNHVDESLIALFAKAAFKMLEKKALLDNEESKQPLCSIISACTVKYDYGISSIVTIVDLLHKFEHLPVHMADLVVLAEKQLNGSSMAVDLLRAIGQIDPKNFERDNAGAENVGLFLEELAVRLPKLVTSNLSVILCHMDGKSYKLRNSLVKVVGALVLGAIKDADRMNSNDVTRLRNEQALLSILIERSRDVAAHTRKHVLQTWANLCKEHAVPIGHWNLVSDLAAGRLEDSAAIVRKSALQLLATLLEYNPFGPSLRTAAFEATFDKYNEKLAAMSRTEEPVTDVGQSTSENDANVDQHADGGPTDPTELEQPQSEPGSSPRVPQAPNPEISTEIGGLEHTRALVASLESALRFSKCIGSAMDTLSQLLASSSLGDVESTIKLLILCRKFEVDGAAACLRKTLPLVFSHEERISLVVEEAFQTLYLRANSPDVALNLINLTLEASLGDLASIEALVNKSMSQGQISAGTLSALWDFFTFNVQGSTADQSRGALTVLSMAAKSSPQILGSHVQNILDIGFGRWAKDDVLLARSACIALQRLPEKSRASFKHGHKIFGILSKLIVGPGLSEACWYAAAEQSVNTIYALHPAPESFFGGLLRNFAQSVFAPISRATSTNQDNEEADVEQQPQDVPLSAVALSRFLFVVAHVALKHLVYIEMNLKVICKRRNDAEKSAADDEAEKRNSDPDVAPPKEGNIAAELGLDVSDDAKLDDLADRAEKELISGDKTQKFLIGAIAPMVSRLCLNSTYLQRSQRLQSSAMLALCKLMVIDASFCENHLQLLFTVAQNLSEDSVRSNCIITLGDLALRFPNLLEPWMELLYARVHDQSNSVRKNTVLVLSHLILNDLIKVKGYISEMAVHLEDEDSRISDLVKLLFHELSKKGNNPINNLLPDILSRLSGNSTLSQDHFNSIMQFLIGTIKKTKQMEGLIEKFCNRFVGNSDARQWQDIAFCLCQLSYSQSCLKKLADNFKLYQHALGDVTVIEHLKSLIVKTRKLATADVKSLLDEYEEKILNWHKEKSEQDALFHKAQEHQQRTEALKAQYQGHANGEAASPHDEDSESEVGGRTDPDTDDAKSLEEPIASGHTEAGNPPSDLSSDTRAEDQQAEPDRAEFEANGSTIFDEVAAEHVTGTVGNTGHVEQSNHGGHVGDGRPYQVLEGESFDMQRNSVGEHTANERRDQTGASQHEDFELSDSDVSQPTISQENFTASQPYPYASLDLETPSTREETLGSATRLKAAVSVKKEIKSEVGDDIETEVRHAWPRRASNRRGVVEVKIEMDHDVEDHEDSTTESNIENGDHRMERLGSKVRSSSKSQKSTRKTSKSHRLGKDPSSAKERSLELHELTPGQSEVLKPRKNALDGKRG